jgi:phosphoglycerate kinase
MIKKIADLELRGKTVFVRVDFNVPIASGKIGETHRIDSALPTIEFILRAAKKLVIASHLGRPDGKIVSKYSMALVRDYLARALGRPVVLAPDCVGDEVSRLVAEDKQPLVLLENLRFHKEEEQNDPAFARALAGLAQVYVNDAFGAAHRAHASIAGMADFFTEKGAGLLMQKELEYLAPILSEPKKPFVTILGGAKVSDKIGVIRNLLPRIDALLIGGGMAYTFLQAQRIGIGDSLVERDKIDVARDILSEAERNRVRIALPLDHVTGDKDKKDPQTFDRMIPPGRCGLDIGPETEALFAAEIGKARSVLWNGPVGLFEVPPFDHGSRSLANALADLYPGVTSIIAGGDTVAAVSAAGVESRISHLSTGGGATLEYLEGKKLPGITALEMNA